MITVYKYPMGASHVPEYGEVVGVGMQNGAMYVWIWVDTDKPTMRRQFQVFETGHEVPADAQHWGLVQEPPFVWHVFEVFA